MILFVCDWMVIQAIASALLCTAVGSREVSRASSNTFLNTRVSPRRKYEESVERIETTREFCLDEFRKKDSSSPSSDQLPRRQASSRSQALSPLCAQYCSETLDCQQSDEQTACLDPTWPSKGVRFVQKVNRMCYVRVTKIQRYHEAEKTCQDLGLSLAVIDNLALLEKLKELNLFNTTCKGQCPTARGYYIGLTRLSDDDNPLKSTWVWSNNFTWVQNETECGDPSKTSYANASLLCYLGSDGKKKVTVWNVGEPNNYRTLGSQSGEACVEIIVETDKGGASEQVGRLNDIPCNKPTLGAICQIEDTKPVNLSRLEYFTAMVGFNETEPSADDDLLDGLFGDLGGPITADVGAMARMAAALEGLLVLPSFSNKQATTVFNVVDQLVDVSGQIDVEDKSLKLVTNKLLHFLDRFPAKIKKTDEAKVSFEYENMNMSVVSIRIDQTTPDWYTIPSEPSSDNGSTIIELNLRVLQRALLSSNDYRVIETIFSNFNLFPQVNSSNFGVPISYQIANHTSVHADEDLIRFQIRVPPEIQDQNVSCAYWSFNERNGSWVVDSGCRFVGYLNDYAQCYCNHLTHFALLMLSESNALIPSLSTVEEFILTFVTYFGICLSTVGLLITMITFILFRRKQRNNLHLSLIMLCLAIFIVNCLYVPFSLTKPNPLRASPISLCNILGFLFHYFFLASFMWMFIMSLIQYMHFVRIFNTHISYFFVKASLIGWIVPLVFPACVVLYDPNRSYTGKVRCWIDNDTLLALTLILPVSTVIMCNLILFGFILRSIFQHNAMIVSHQKNQSRLQISAALCCFVSMGCTWLFGIVVLVRPSFVNQLIFCVCNSFQGFLIFLFHVYLSKAKRESWQTFLIERGLHPQSRLVSTNTDRLTTSHSSGGNITSIIRPVKFRFNATSTSSSDQQVSLGQIHPVSIDYQDRKQVDFAPEQVKSPTQPRNRINNSYA